MRKRSWLVVLDHSKRSVAKDCVPSLELFFFSLLLQFTPAVHLQLQLGMGDVIYVCRVTMPAIQLTHTTSLPSYPLQEKTTLVGERKPVRFYGDKQASWGVSQYLKMIDISND